MQDSLDVPQLREEIFKLTARSTGELYRRMPVHRSVI